MTSAEGTCSSSLGVWSAMTSADWRTGSRSTWHVRPGGCADVRPRRVPSADVVRGDALKPYNCNACGRLLTTAAMHDGENRCPDCR